MPTHGSLTKAGKVRNQTPKIIPKEKQKLKPRSRNRRNYMKRIAHQPITGRRSFSQKR